MDDMDSALPIHSLAEAYLYLMVTPCQACGKGPVKADESRVHHDARTRGLSVPVKCSACQRESLIWFDTRGVSPDALTPDPNRTPPVNPTDEPSHIIDVAGWLTLFSVIADHARTIGDAADKRRLLLEAAQCLDEALKFYDEDNELPPEEAFFRDAGRRQLRARPETFARRRLLELRAKMPHPTRPQHDDQPARVGKRRWWWPWGKR